MIGKNIRQDLNNKLIQYYHLEKSITEEEGLIKECKEKIENILQAQVIVQSLAEEIQNNIHNQISSVVTKCLNTVFGEDSYTFKIKFVKRRGKTEAELLFLKGGLEIDPISSSGGGVIDLASFALRLSCLILSQPKSRKILFLDEPFRMLSKNHIPEVKQLLKSLSKELNIQMIIITHNSDLATGKVIEI